MSDAMTGFLIWAGIIHFFLVLIPVIGTIKSTISVQSKIAWCLFLLLLESLLTFTTDDDNVGNDGVVVTTFFRRCDTVNIIWRRS